MAECPRAHIQVVSDGEGVYAPEAVEEDAPYVVMISEQQEEMMIASMPVGVDAMLLMDSGSCVHACPREFASWFGLDQGASRVKATTADGSSIADYGERAVSYSAEGGLRLKSRFHVMNVRRPILSVGLLEAAGHQVSFGARPIAAIFRHNIARQAIAISLFSFGLYLIFDLFQNIN